MHLEVHPHSLRAIIKHYGSARIIVDASSPLLPLLVTKPHRPKAKLTKSIELIGTPAIIAQIRDDAGYNLYRHHLTQLMEWITLSVTNGVQAYTAMMEYYAASGLDIGELDPSSVYRQWYRLQRQKNIKKNAHISPITVLKNAHHHKSTLADALEIVSEAIHEDPDIYYTRSGLPDAGMIRKAIMWALSHHCRWSQYRIAEAFDLHRSVVGRHIQGFSPYATVLLP